MESIPFLESKGRIPLKSVRKSKISSKWIINKSLGSREYELIHCIKNKRQTEIAQNAGQRKREKGNRKWRRKGAAAISERNIKKEGVAEFKWPGI